MVALTAHPFAESVKESKSMNLMGSSLATDFGNVEPMLKRTFGTRSLGSV
jgi:hypothetical protein